MQLDPTTDDAFRSFLPGAQQQDDAALIIRFFVDKKLLGLKSQEAGRPIYEDREYVEIKIKGQPKQVVVEEVNAKHKIKFPNAYAAFKANCEVPVVGTPIEQLPGIGPSMAANLKTFGIRTIEDMAALNDIGIQNVGGGARDLQKRAKAFLSQTSEKAVALEDENKLLREQLAAMNARLDKVDGGGEPAKKARKPRATKAATAPSPEMQQ